MRTVPIAQWDASVIIAGMMRIADLDAEAIRALYDTARECGVNVFDHADIYGGAMHRCEDRFSAALKLTSRERQEIILQSKCGIVPAGSYYDLSFDHILSQVEHSLRALRTDHLDILLLHRPDALSEPEEIARAFDALEASGKVLRFGVSNHTPMQIDLLRASVSQPLVVNQLQLSLTHAPAITQPLASNMRDLDQSIVRDGGGVVDYSRLSGMTLQAWSPFQSGFLDGTFLGSAAHAELNTTLERLAAEHDSTPTGVATAWILRHPARMQVVVGTTKPQRMRDAAAGADISLTRPEWYELLRSAGHSLP